MVTLQTSTAKSALVCSIRFLDDNCQTNWKQQDQQKSIKPNDGKFLHNLKSEDSNHTCIDTNLLIAPTLPELDKLRYRLRILKAGNQGMFHVRDEDDMFEDFYFKGGYGNIEEL